METLILPRRLTSPFLLVSLSSPRNSFVSPSCEYYSNTLLHVTHITIQRWNYASSNVVIAVEHDKGGHFAAWEVPNYLAGDLKKMFGIGGPAFGVVPGKSGYTVA